MTPPSECTREDMEYILNKHFSNPYFVQRILKSLDISKRAEFELDNLTKLGNAFGLTKIGEGQKEVLERIVKGVSI